IIEHGLGHGGSVVSLTRLLLQLDRRRVHPVVLLDSRDASTEVLQRTGLQVTKCPQPFERWFRHSRLRPPLSYLQLLVEFLCSVLPQAAQLSRVIRREQVDLVHLNNHLSQYAGLLAARLSGVPCVVHLRKTKTLRTTERLAARLADQFIALSIDGMRHYAAEGLPRERMAIVYDPVFHNGDVSADGIATRHAFGAPSGVPVIGILSRLAPGKGHEHFLQAAKLVSQRHPHARFLVVGAAQGAEGRALAKRLHAFAQKFGLQERVLFTGWRSDVPRIIASLDVVVDASTVGEGTRLTVLESMSMGKPVVATRVGSEAEFFEEGRGILVEPGRPDQLAQAILWLLEDKGRANEMGQKAKDRALDRCSPLRAAGQLERIYDAALAARSSRR
ncbi:MAG TPA: glycosyltransferase, partial [archaeon]|nr:glycosyltransferase [archaeon]